MRVLAIGGAGTVGRLVAPVLARDCQLTCYDLAEPAGHCDFVRGDVRDRAALNAAMAGMDAVLYLAMGSLAWDTPEGVRAAFEVNIEGVYNALEAAARNGAAPFVYASTMSIYAGDLARRRFDSEDVPPDSTELYGLTKRLGEEVCRAAAERYGIRVLALRLWHPVSDEHWHAGVAADGPSPATAASDVAAAFLAALRCGGRGFDALMVTGDYDHRITNLGRAAGVLGWRPLARPGAAASAAHA